MRQPSLISSRSPIDLQAAPIGLFDSGVGGLTVLRQLQRQLPNEALIYFADTARIPYGSRSKAEILAFVREIMHWMLQQGVKMVIMACNTSSALALEVIQAEFSVPILGLILPGARAAAQENSQRVGVIATSATVASHAYHSALLEANAQLEVWEVACPKFVPLIEQGRLYEQETITVAQQYIAPLLPKNIDTLIYGCTHYPHLAPIFKTFLPPTIRLINPATHVVRAATNELEALGLRYNGPALKTRFYVSGCPEQFAQLSQQWLGSIPHVEQVILSYCPTAAS